MTTIPGGSKLSVTYTSTQILSNAGGSVDAPLEPPRSLLAHFHTRARGIRSHMITKQGPVPTAPTRSSTCRCQTAPAAAAGSALIDASRRRGGTRRRRGRRSRWRWWPVAPTTWGVGRAHAAHRRRLGQLVCAAAGRAGCESTRKQRVTGEKVRRCADEGKDSDGRGGGLGKPHRHLHGVRVTHRHVRAGCANAREMGARRRGEEEAAAFTLDGGRGCLCRESAGASARVQGIQKSVNLQLCAY